MTPRYDINFNGAIEHLRSCSFRQFPKSPWELDFTVSDKVYNHWRLLGTETAYDVSKRVFKDMCDGDSGEPLTFILYLQKSNVQEDL